MCAGIHELALFLSASAAAACVRACVFMCAHACGRVHACPCENNSFYPTEKREKAVLTSSRPAG